MNGQRLRPLGLGDIFDEGFDLYKRNFVFFFLVTAITVVPLDVVMAFGSPRLFPALFDLFGITSNTDAFGVWFTVSLAELALFLPVFLLAVAPLVRAASGQYLEQEQTPWQVYRPVLRRLPGLLVLGVLISAALDLGLLFCLVPWALAAVQIFFSLHGFVVEGKGPIQALRRSSTLVSGYGGRVFNCLFLLGLIGWVLSLGVSFPLSYVFDNALHFAPGAQSLYGGMSGAPQTSEEQVVSLLSNGLAHLVLIPFVVSVMTVLYYDLRIRKEGFDIELLAEELHYPPLNSLGAFLPPVSVFPVRPPSYGKRPK
jgi:hypothetical protein